MLALSADENAWTTWTGRTSHRPGRVARSTARTRADRFASLSRRRGPAEAEAVLGESRRGRQVRTAASMLCCGRRRSKSRPMDIRPSDSKPTSARCPRNRPCHRIPSDLLSMERSTIVGQGRLAGCRRRGRRTHPWRLDRAPGRCPLRSIRRSPPDAPRVPRNAGRGRAPRVAVGWRPASPPARRTVLRWPLSTLGGSASGGASCRKRPSRGRSGCRRRHDGLPVR